MPRTRPTRTPARQRRTANPRRPSNLANDTRVLAGNELLILRLLREHGESHGMRLVALSNGALSQGTVYTTLARMHAKDYVESWLKRGVESGGPPLRAYRATAYGARMLDAMEAFAAATARGG